MKSSFTSNLPEVPLCFLTVKDLYPSDCQNRRVNSDSAVSLEPLQGPWKAEAPWGKWPAVLSLLFLGPTQTVVSSAGLLEFDFVSAKLWYVSLGVYFPQCIVLPCNKIVLNYVAMNHQRQSWRWKSKNTVTSIQGRKWLRKCHLSISLCCHILNSEPFSLLHLYYNMLIVVSSHSYN